jgi:DNA-binding winged helix-turn-helix (wHTH) protein/uncharacterized membrane protein
MRKSDDPYVFAGVRFLPDRWMIEVCETKRKFPLSQIQRKFLLALVEKPREVVTYDELRIQVWPHEPEMDQRVQHTIQVTKGNLSRLLEDNGIKADFIEAVSGQGYRLAADISPVTEDKTEEETPSHPDGDSFTPAKTLSKETERPIHQEPSTILYRLFGRHLTFILVGSIFYGLLFWIALLLETAYDFDAYGSSSFWLGIPITLINIGAVVAALSLAQKRLRVRKGGGLLVGLIILIFAVIVSCWLASVYLPHEPVTLSRFQAQPASAAFLKNAALYFWPLCVVFILMPFYYVVAVELKAQRIIQAEPADTIFLSPNFLTAVCLAAIIYSLVSTFYLLDNLQTGKYHNFFVSLIFLRFIVSFSLGFGSLQWYKKAISAQHLG